jgi:hypothetical protein
MMKILKHLEKILVVCGKHLVPMNISPRKRRDIVLTPSKWEGSYTSKETYKKDRHMIKHSS